MDINFLLERKKKLKLSYDDLSRLSGIPKTTLTNILLGRTPNPRIDTMKAIERALKIDSSDDFPVSYEEFSERVDENPRWKQIAALPPEKQQIVFDTIDALLKNLDK